MIRIGFEHLRGSMENRKLRVLIVSTIGAHQKAIQALCASKPQIDTIDMAFSTPQAFELIRKNLPDLIILGANLSQGQVCEFLSQMGTLPKPPHCIALTVSEFRTCLDQPVDIGQVIPTTMFALRLPEILDQVSVK